MSAAPADIHDRVAAAIREVAAEVIEPRFTRLREGLDLRVKAPGEIVTVADEEAERRLTKVLAALWPGTPVVGEEACAAHPGLIDAVHADRTWLLDPIDGTANFAAGCPDWAVMVALLEKGKAVASWIWRTERRAMYAAERGSGATRDGVPLQAPARPSRPADLRGAVLSRFLDEPTAEQIAAHRHQFGEITAGRRCAGSEYPAVIEGEQDFVLFWRALPWDHAPGALLLHETGGVLNHLDGSPYRPTSTRQGILAAPDPSTWQIVRTKLSTREPTRRDHDKASVMIVVTGDPPAGSPKGSASEQLEGNGDGLLVGEVDLEGHLVGAERPEVGGQRGDPQITLALDAGHVGLHHVQRLAQGHLGHVPARSQLAQQVPVGLGTGLPPPAGPLACRLVGGVVAQLVVVGVELVPPQGELGCLAHGVLLVR